MKLCIVGLGAIGGYLAARLAASGARVSALARGETASTVAREDFRLLSPDGDLEVRLPVSEAAADLGAQDAVILTLKAQAVPDVAPQLGPLLGPDTAVVSAYNGVPWWYFAGVGGPHDGRRVAHVDPDGIIHRHIAPRRVIGAIVYPAAEVIAPGVVRHLAVNRFSLGEPSGAVSERVTALAEAFAQAGLETPVTGAIRNEIWIKLAANISTSPLSVVTGATMRALLSAESTRAQVERLIGEVAAVAEAAGHPMPLSPDQLITAMARTGDHKTSMLQDFEKGKPLELDPLTGAVLEIAGWCRVATPAIAQIDRAARRKLQDRDRNHA